MLELTTLCQHDGLSGRLGMRDVLLWPVVPPGLQRGAPGYSETGAERGTKGFG